MRILVVDDDQTILDLIGRFFEISRDHGVVTASSAMVALEEIEEAEDPFDCFLLDIQMPEADGIVLTKLIRETPGYETAPIVMLTAMHDMRYLNRAFSAGATDYVTKPFEYEDLMSRLQAAQELALDKEIREPKARSAGEAADPENGNLSYRLQDPFHLEDVTSAIAPAEFENYVFELSRRRFFGVSAFAVKIGSIAKVYEQWGPQDFAGLVRNVALIIEKTLCSGGGILSYRGNGTFLCVPENRPKEPRDVLEASINKRFEVLQPRYSRAVSHLFVAGPVTLGNKTNSELMTALSSAIDTVVTRAADFRETPSVSKRILANLSLTEPERHLEQRAYEVLLRTALSEPESSSWHRKLGERRQNPRGR